MRHPVYSALNKPRLLFGVDYRILVGAIASGLPILAFTHGRFALMTALALPFVTFALGATAFRNDPQFLLSYPLKWRLQRRLDPTLR